MTNKEYLLDANIVIKIWKVCPHLFKDMKKARNLDFKISRYIAEELSIKEFTKFNGVQVLTERFLELLDHIIDVEIDDVSQLYPCNESVKSDLKKDIHIKEYNLKEDIHIRKYGSVKGAHIIKYDSQKNIYIINENKISKGDFSLIYACEVNKDYILVTEDKRLLSSAKFILDPAKVMNFDEFMEDLQVSLSYALY
ncbi:hypothetical protein GOM49_05530 [Clostridium bovifaecis]|uniref:PIN domain-containing protein n=1 Tax=Clostridium bovifaecis TaxID=2184719 RepID=A0A6I6F050_9CLOT|nr:hypothetical protein GOM49_05530 [Clostridium bovifaecis]